jgi:hypothetical protein
VARRLLERDEAQRPQERRLLDEAEPERELEQPLELERQQSGLLAHRVAALAA